MKALGVIPARGGSKRCHRKNIRPLCGRPLIAYTIDAAKAATSLSEFVVSTEDSAVAAIAEAYGAKVIDQPMASDTSTSGQVCKYALETMGDYDLVVLLHPTSPVRDHNHIDQAVAMLLASDAPALSSVACRKRCYYHNAALYAMRADWLRKTSNHFCDESLPFLMDADHSIDIDTERDFQIAETIIQCRLAAIK